MWQQWLQDLQAGDIRALARSISVVENGLPGYEALLQALPPPPPANVIGITGPPGAGKSTLVDALLGVWVNEGKKVAVLCVDPSSPFHLGAVLGDRIRMSNWYTHPHVFIRSLASRGAMGGLHPKIIEITDLVNAAGFDYVLVETVGVGQSEIEIAGLADTTVVVVVPEAGDEVQTMKAGLMEIANIFVVNKSDRPGADAFVKNLRLMLAPAFAHHPVPVIKTVASAHTGISALNDAIVQELKAGRQNERKAWLLAERAYQLIQQQRMQNVKKVDLEKEIRQQVVNGRFHLYRFVQHYSQERPSSC